MTNQEFGTLAYTKSPKTSRRTTFQDELKAAVSARATKTKMDKYSYSDFDDEDEEDDVFNKLLNSRKKKSSAFQAMKNKAAINEFELSDTERKHGRTKRVSFLKTQTTYSPSEDTTESDSHEHEPPDLSVPLTNDYNSSFSSQHSTDDNEHSDASVRNGDGESTGPQIAREDTSKHSSDQALEDTLLDASLPFDSSEMEPPGPEQKNNFPLEESSQTLQLSENDLMYLSSADSAAEKEPPRPKPRQRTFKKSLQTIEKISEDAESQDLSRPQTSSVSIPLSTDTSSDVACADDHMRLCNLSKSSSGKSEQSQLLAGSTVDSGSRDDFIFDNAKERDSKYSTSLEELNQDSMDHSNQVSHGHKQTFDSRPRSQRSQSSLSGKVEAKYLGSLKFLDHKVSLEESQPQKADSLRAAVYQDWLQKKKETLKKNIHLKKMEEVLEERKKKDNEARREDAVAAFEAWKKGNVENLKVKAKEKQEKLRKEQRETEEREEKRQSAKQLYEKWKLEHDRRLKVESRKKEEAESKLQLQKQEKEQERKTDCKCAYTTWCEKKKNVIYDQVRTARKAIQIKAEEDWSMKEERDKMALEIYENWLARKDLEQKRQREERRIQAILRDSPPPPWNPPNKTIPFRK